MSCEGRRKCADLAENFLKMQGNVTVKATLGNSPNAKWKYKYTNIHLQRVSNT